MARPVRKLLPLEPAVENLQKTSLGGDDDGELHNDDDDNGDGEDDDDDLGADLCEFVEQSKRAERTTPSRT